VANELFAADPREDSHGLPTRAIRKRRADAHRHLQPDRDPEGNSYPKPHRNGDAQRDGDDHADSYGHEHAVTHANRNAQPNSHAHGHGDGNANRDRHPHTHGHRYEHTHCDCHPHANGDLDQHTHRHQYGEAYCNSDAHDSSAEQCDDHAILPRHGRLVLLWAQLGVLVERVRGDELQDLFVRVGQRLLECGPRGIRDHHVPGVHNPVHDSRALHPGEDVQELRLQRVFVQLRNGNVLVGS
jgi:hypothetical protein